VLAFLVNRGRTIFSWMNLNQGKLPTRSGTDSVASHMRWLVKVEFHVPFSVKWPSSSSGFRAARCLSRGRSQI
jgi:hypothetical protein